jgi:hypothetical protein
MGIAKGEYKGYEAYFIVQVFGKSYWLEEKARIDPGFFCGKIPYQW